MEWTMSNRGYDPFGTVRDLQREMNRLFHNYEGDGGTFPAVNIWGDQDKVVVTAELPGVKPEDIDISVVQGQLSIQGERKIIEPEADAVCHRSERGEGRFSRGFRLPYDIDNEKVEAKCKNGVLVITLPRLEETKPRKITVKVD